MTLTTNEATKAFQPINRGYDAAFRVNRLSVGLVVPIENYATSSIPKMDKHIERVQLAEALGFSSVWLRDVPFNVPSFGDAGQTYDPFVYLGLLAGLTREIALGVASIILPLRHPAHVAKAAATADVLSGGRLILGVASGDRPDEYPALNISFADRGERFRESFDYIRRMSDQRPSFESVFGSPGREVDMLPKPVSGKLPMLITGGSQQNPDWLAKHGDGWMLYPREVTAQAQVIRDWRSRVQDTGRPIQPAMEPLYIDLADNPNTPAQPIHLGFRLGTNHLRDYLKAREEIGVNHVALNLRFNQADVETTMKRLADQLFPDFN
ncbi:luciferase-type oxidoreductase, BA3436 family [Neorhodopirellula lusitana]|uniref:Luciferase-type oxidoreductase, BA3436 family n=1 Tax=Neorhodopirellula lusitana TaxID=445327 RepID=A0ABY1QGG2_9BACT|nr:LLM class oxidoreductase [Neorhodopirellula lusitana]SMP67587.1 luciferase-type oxidoreductase, BA3436 family [Neorhodopirellula lusitana]